MSSITSEGNKHTQTFTALEIRDDKWKTDSVNQVIIKTNGCNFPKSVSELTLSDLPDEILEKIFIYLKDDKNQRTLKALTEVCRKFNDIISRSSHLMKMLTVYWAKDTNNDVEVITVSRRMFQKISIININDIDSNMMKFFNNFHSTLTKISLAFSSLTIAEFKRIMEVVGDNLKILKLNYLNLSGDAKQNIAPINFPKLDCLELTHLNYTGAITIFKLFKGAANVKKFVFDEGYKQEKLQEVHIDELSQLLINFTKLQDLELLTNNLYFLKNILFVKNIKFSLERYSHGCSVVNADFDEMDLDACPYLVNFLSAQHASLDTLTLFQFLITSEVIDIIMDMYKLKQLSIHRCNFLTSKSKSIKNTSIRILTIGSFDDRNFDYNSNVGVSVFLSNCINVEELNLFDFDLTFPMSESISNMKNLKSFKYLSNNEKFKIFPMTFSSVTKMEFLITYSKNYDDIINLIQLNPQVKDMKLPKSIRKHPKYSFVIGSLNLEKLCYYPY